MNKKEFQPYVTANGGVVILNGPFPLKKAREIAALCKAAPDLLEAAKLALEKCPFPVGAMKAKEALEKSIAEAEILQ